MRSAVLFSLLAGVLAAISFDSADAILSTCVGFVTLKTGLTAPKDHIDYAGITIGLRKQADGLSKGSVSVDPNGHYVLPIYDHGQYYLSIKSASGWKFEREQVAVSVTNDNEGAEIIVDFMLVGFPLRGTLSGSQLRSCVVSSLPSVSVSTDSITTESDANGVFVFPSLAPGQHVLASPSTSPSNVSVKQLWGGADVGPVFQLNRATVRGSIRADNSAAGVNVFLVADADDSIGCERAQDLSGLPEELVGSDKTVCAVVSDASGAFSFASLPCGAYRLLAFCEKRFAESSTSVKFDVMPNQFEFKVGYEDVDLGAIFRVAGFSISSRVVHANGAGVADAQVLVDDEPRAVTDADGFYTLDQFKFGRYVIRVYKEGITFESLPTVSVSASDATIPNIAALKYQFCGRAYNGVDSVARTIQIKAADGTVSSTKTDLSGEFCFDAVPGKYVVSPALTSSERRAEMVLSPAERELELIDRPVVGVDFSQAMVSVSGRVQCLPTNGCEGEATVTLTSSRSQGGGIQQQTKNGAFVFEKVSPGEYLISVALQGACFELASKPLSVGTAGVSDVEFVQSGYEIVVQSSHASGLSLRPSSQPKQAPILVEVPAGRSIICLPSLQAWTIEPTSCFRFGDAATIELAANQRTLDLKTSRVKVEGTISIAANASAPADIRVRVQGGESVVAVAVADQNLFRYSFFARPGQEHELRVETPGSDALIIAPASLAVSVLPDAACPPVLAPFEGRPAVFRRGTVLPVVVDARVVATVVGNPDEVLSSCTLDAEGNYEIGPLSETMQYEIGVRAAGFHFVDLGSGNFRSQAYSGIDVAILNEDGKPVEGVLVSLSGHGFRRSAQTFDNGRTMFDELFADQYYVQPLLKEYEFRPASQRLQAVEGNRTAVTFVAVRHAFSVFGAVSNLNGDAVSGVTILATDTSTQGSVEETSSDATGRFRLRGLLPGKRYEIVVKGEGIDRCSPSSHTVEMREADEVGKEFVVFRSLNRFDVSGSIPVLGDWVKSFDVQLRTLSSDAVVLRQALISPQLRYFDFTSLPPGEFLLRVVANVAGAQGRQAEMRIDARDAHQHVNVEFVDAVETVAENTGLSFFFTLIIGFVLIISVLNAEAILGKLKKMQYRPKPALASDWASSGSSKPGSRRTSRR